MSKSSTEDKTPTNEENGVTTTGEAAAPVEEAPARPDPYELVEIKLPLTKKGPKRVFVSVNNRTFSIACGVKVKVPRYVAAVIENADKQNEATIQLIDGLVAEAA